MLKSVLLQTAAIVSLTFSPSLAESCDLLIKNGRLLDGSGNPWRFADIAISGATIQWVGDVSHYSAKKTIDAGDLFVAPGFIDVHTHAAAGLSSTGLNRALPFLKQGVTTVFLNPDGGGPIDIQQQRESLLAQGLGVNVAMLVPHGSIRSAVLGMSDRAPDREELDLMRTLVRRGMQNGAFGLSSGTFYAPGSYSSTEEIIALARVTAAFRGVYTSHIRDESDYNIGVIAAVEEVIRVSREAKLPGIITHIKVLGQHVRGLSNALVRRIEKARAEGVEIYADQYPYEASATGLSAALLPRWALVGGRSELQQRLDDPDILAQIKTEMRSNLERRGGAQQLQFRRVASDPSIEGKTLLAVAEAREVLPIDLAVELVRAGNPGIVSFNMDPEDVRTLMKPSWVMTASDGGLVPMGVGVPHPRNYGTFPRKIRKYVLEEKVMDLPNAIRSMTSLPAAVFGIPNRGLIRPGAVADIAIFDLNRFKDLATYQEPHRLSEGMIHVVVNGQLVLEHEAYTNTLAGQVLSKPR